jgi:site-specific recombinase
LPVLRLRHLLNQIDRHRACAKSVQGLATAFWRDVDAAVAVCRLRLRHAPVAGQRTAVAACSQRVLPGTPETQGPGRACSALLFQPDDLAWIEALDDATCACSRAAGHRRRGDPRHAADAINILVSSVHAAGYSPALRQRMDPALLQDEPFRQLTAASAAAACRAAGRAPRPTRCRKPPTCVRCWTACRRAADSVMPHLEQYGVSVNIVFSLDQLRAAPAGGAARRLPARARPGARGAPPAGQPAGARWRDVRSVRALMAGQYSLLARQVAERSAETGEHYITRDRAEYRDMLRRAAGGGAVIAGTTFVKFAVAASG